MEINGFAWIFFLWDNIKEDFSDGRYKVRLDKFAFSEISWESDFLQSMINRRFRYFSDGLIEIGQQICDEQLDFENELKEMILLVQKSPRELVRILVDSL